MIRPAPRIIREIGQGNGSPRGFGFPRIISVESAISSTPETMKHIFESFCIIVSFVFYFRLPYQRLVLFLLRGYLKSAIDYI